MSRETARFPSPWLHMRCFIERWRRWRMLKILRDDPRHISYKRRSNKHKLGNPGLNLVWKQHWRKYMLKHWLPLNPKESCGEKGKRLGVVERHRDEMDSDPPGGIAPRLTECFIACSILSAVLCRRMVARTVEGRGRTKKNKHVVLFTDAIHRLRGFFV